jgi:putative membrane protein insertion efficiency factor
MKTLRVFLKLWKFISFPIFGNCCRFYPTCSEYFVEAIEKKGAINGSILGIKRICRCHPFSINSASYSGKNSGFDPVLDEDLKESL